MPRTLTPPRAWSPDSDRSSETATTRRRIGEAMLATALLFVIAYGGSWRNSFHFDDSHVIETNPAIRSLANIPRFFADARTFSSLPDNQTYRPIVTMTLAIDHAIASATTGNGLDPRPYHVTQLLLLALVAALVGLLARQLYADAASEDDGLDVVGSGSRPRRRWVVRRTHRQLRGRQLHLGPLGVTEHRRIARRTAAVSARRHLASRASLSDADGARCAEQDARRPLRAAAPAVDRSLERHVDPAALLSTGGRSAFKRALLRRCRHSSSPSLCTSSSRE